MTIRQKTRPDTARVENRAVNCIFTILRTDLAWWCWGWGGGEVLHHHWLCEREWRRDREGQRGTEPVVTCWLTADRPGQAAPSSVCGGKPEVTEHTSQLRLRLRLRPSWFLRPASTSQRSGHRLDPTLSPRTSSWCWKKSFPSFWITHTVDLSSTQLMQRPRGFILITSRSVPAYLHTNSSPLSPVFYSGGEYLPDISVLAVVQCLASSTAQHGIFQSFNTLQCLCSLQGCTSVQDKLGWNISK